MFILFYIFLFKIYFLNDWFFYIDILTCIYKANIYQFSLMFEKFLFQFFFFNFIDFPISSTHNDYKWKIENSKIVYNLWSYCNLCNFPVLTILLYNLTYHRFICSRLSRSIFITEFYAHHCLPYHCVIKLTM